MSRTIIGLDLSETALSAVVVRSAMRSKSVASWLRFPLDGPVPFGDVLDQALNALIAQVSIKEAIWVAGLPSRWVSLRNLRVPFGEPKKIRQVLPFEMEPLLALAIDEMIVDFHIAGPSAGRSADIIAAAAEVGPIRGYLDRLALRGIKPAWITAGHYGLPRLLAEMGEAARNSLCIQMEANGAQVAAIVASRLALLHRFALPRDQPLGPGLVTLWLQQVISMVEAFGLARFNPEVIWIGADSAGSVPAEALGEAIAPVTVKALDLVHDLEWLKLEPACRDWPGQALDRALALALLEAQDIGRINFRRGPLAPRRPWEEHKTGLAVTAGSLCLVAGLGLAGVIFDVTQKQRRVWAIDRQVAAVFGTMFADGTKMADPVGQTRARIEEIRKQARFAEDREGGHRVIDILADISAGIAKNIDVAVTRLEVGADAVTLSGDTATFDAVDEIKQKLQAAAAFKEVTIASSNKDKTGSRIQFKLQMQLK